MGGVIWEVKKWGTVIYREVGSLKNNLMMKE